ncbi:MAG: thermonuclease family protein [Methylorubrum rhodinum]|uniref:thermonuclease family protein n=1 Tax=Methylorubrum rhodinum TaxID=29428 RepID=UPI003BB0FF2D
MSLTATIALLYAACLVGAIASPAVAKPTVNKPTAPAPRRRPWRAPVVLALPLAALVLGAPVRPAQAGEAATRIAALALLAPLAAPVVSLTGPATVIDGATLAVAGRPVRLHGIAAPTLGQTCFDAQERGYPCGRVAAEALRARIGDASIACEAQGAAEDGSPRARCRLGGDDLAAWLVENGYAVADRGVSADYAAQDARAWGRRRGLWAGVFDLPTKGARTATAGL